MARYAPYALSVLLMLLSLLAWFSAGGGWWIAVVVFGALAALGTADLLQTRSTLRRNYPLLAHFRYSLESIGPELRQYFFQSDTMEVPYSRQQRALIYQRSNNEMDVVPFGTLRSTYAVDYEWINHSMAPTVLDTHDFRVWIGGTPEQAAQRGDAEQEQGAGVAAQHLDLPGAKGKARVARVTPCHGIG